MKIFDAPAGTEYEYECGLRIITYGSPEPSAAQLRLVHRHRRECEFARVEAQKGPEPYVLPY